MPDRLLRVFLCHSSTDKSIVRGLFYQLNAESWMDVWLDEEKLYPGQDWDMEIEKAVGSSDVVIVCLSNNSVSKEGYVQRELRFVLRFADFKPDGAIFVIPVRLDDCPMPPRMAMWQYIDLFPKSREEWAYQRLLVSLRMRANSLGILTEQSGVISSSEKSKPAPKRETLETDKSFPVQETTKVEKKRKVIEPSGNYTPGGHAIYTFGEIDFVKVPAGSFLMGTNDSAKNASGTSSDEKPQHTVDLPYEYFIGRFPATNGNYAGYVKAVGSKHPVNGWENKRDHPVVDASWNDVMAYCKWLNDLLKGKLPIGLALRLPTEAEWEKAARGEKGLIYPWGNLFDKNKCNTTESGVGNTTPVGSYSPQGDSPYGCSDMSGNVVEWTHSIYKPYPYQANDGREDIQAKGNRVLRGGSFCYSAWNARCAYRFNLPIFSNSPIQNVGNLKGFRVVLSPDIS